MKSAYSRWRTPCSNSHSLLRVPGADGAPGRAASPPRDAVAVSRTWPALRTMRVTPARYSSHGPDHPLPARRTSLSERPPRPSRFVARRLSRRALQHPGRPPASDRGGRRPCRAHPGPPRPGRPFGARGEPRIGAARSRMLGPISCPAPDVAAGRAHCAGLCPSKSSEALRGNVRAK